MQPTTLKTESSEFGKNCAIAAALLAPFLIYFATARSLVTIWNSSETFTHGYIILPVSLWLIWKRRHTLPLAAAAPFWPGLLLLAACGFGWLLAELADVQVVRQYAFVAMIPLIVLTVLGPRLSWAMAFPLAFLLLAVPFGEIFIDPLINFTADFTVAALRATGIPVLRNGTHFDIPSGSWSVVEACSGLRYLIASFTLGCLYAYLTYRSRTRQAMFILLSIVVPIVANGLRAYMIVMIGHLSGMQLAVGVDHLIYGWIFFGLVMFLMFWAGNYWREDSGNDVTKAVEAVTATSTASSSQTLAIAASVILCIGIWPLYTGYLERAAHNPVPVVLNTFQSSWQETAPFNSWRPRFAPASMELHKYFQHEGQQVGLSVLYYRDPDHDAKLISSLNKMVGEKDTAFRQIGSNVRQENIAGRMLNVREAVLEGSTGPLLVWHWYWIGGKTTVNDYVGKLLQAKETFLMRGDDGAAVMVFAPYTVRQDEARTALRAYLASNLSAIEATLASNSTRQSGK